MSTTFTELQMKEFLALKERDAKAKERQKRQTAKSLILLQKAKAAGITVTDEEIDGYLKAHK